MVSLANFTHILIGIKPYVDPTSKALSLGFTIPQAAQWKLHENSHEDSIRLMRWFAEGKIGSEASHRITAQTRCFYPKGALVYKSMLLKEMKDRLTVLGWKKTALIKRKENEAFPGTSSLIEWSKTQLDTINYLFILTIWYNSHCFILEYETKDPDSSLFKRKDYLYMLKNAQIVENHCKQT